MATQKVFYHSKLPIFVLPCQTVAVCLPAVWSGQTVSGLPIAYATVGDDTRYLGSGGVPLVPIMQNARQVEIMQIELNFDDTQFEVDIVTGLPYVVTCEDIACIDPCACLIKALADAVIEVRDRDPGPE